MQLEDYQIEELPKKLENLERFNDWHEINLGLGDAYQNQIHIHVWWDSI